MNRIILLAFFFLVSCVQNSQETISAADFDQTCTVPSDCVAVKEGGKCCSTTPSCINKGDTDAFNAEKSDAQCSAENDSCLPVVTLLRPTCTDGACVLTDEECEPGTECVGIDP